MNKLSLLLLLLLPFFGFSQQTISLNDGWTFSQADKNTWYEAKVPVRCSMI